MCTLAGCRLHPSTPHHLPRRDPHIKLIGRHMARHHSGLAQGRACGLPVNNEHIVANKAWVEKNPAAAKLSFPRWGKLGLP